MTPRGRAATMLRQRQDGMTYRAIAEHWGVSPSRVTQILARERARHRPNLPYLPRPRHGASREHVRQWHAHWRAMIRFATAAITRCPAWDASWQVAEREDTVRDLLLPRK